MFPAFDLNLSKVNVHVWGVPVDTCFSTKINLWFGGAGDNKEGKRLFAFLATAKETVSYCRLCVKWTSFQAAHPKGNLCHSIFFVRGAMPRPRGALC